MYTSTLFIYVITSITVSTDIPLTCSRRDGAYSGAAANPSISAVSCIGDETMISCGTASMPSGSGGTFIDATTNQCVAYDYSSLYGGYAIALCCVFPSDALISTTSVISQAAQSVSIQCPSDSVLTSCMTHLATGTADSMEGVFAGNQSSPPSEFIDTWIPTDNYCRAEALDGTTVYATARCLHIDESLYSFECETKSVFTDSYNFGTCQAGYTLMSCALLSTTAGFDQYHIHSGLAHCYVQIDNNAMVYVNAICCKMTALTSDPTAAPTEATIAPSINPTIAPSLHPTNPPTMNPSNAPSDSPSNAPSTPPSNAPSLSPTESPTNAPTMLPTNAPSLSPTDSPTACVDYYDYRSLDGIDVIHTQNSTEFVMHEMNDTNENIQKYISKPFVATFFDKEIVCNDTNAEICFILCKDAADCAQSIIKIAPNNRLNELKLMCTGKQSCNQLTINITAASQVNNISVSCAEPLSCKTVSISVVSAHNTDIMIMCNEALSCIQMRIDLITNNTDTKLKVDIICKADYSCDDMVIFTHHSHNIFIDFYAYRYSRNIEIHQQHLSNIHMECGVDKDHRYIRYDTHQLLDPFEILQYSRDEYESTHRLPCEDIHILCSNDTDIERGCFFQYELNNFSLLDILRDEHRPNCYWLDAVQLYKASCVGTCGDDIVYYAYNKTVEFQLVFDSNNWDEDEQRRLLGAIDNNFTTTSYQICDEYFGSLNESKSTLSSIDAIFQAILQIIAAVDGSTVNNVLQAPFTQLMDNEALIACKNEEQNIIGISTNFVIDSIESNEKVIDKLFAKNGQFMTTATDLLSDLFGFKIEFETVAFSTIHEGVEETVVIVIVFSALCIIAVIVVFIIKKRKLERQRVEALTTYICNPMILMIGIAFYEQEPESPAIDGYFRDLDGIHKDIENVNEIFDEKLNYSVYPKQRKQEWKAKEIMTFLEEKAAELENNLDEYDGLVVFVSCHGVKYNIVSSDYQLIERTAIHRIFSMDRPAVRKIPRVFVFDCCAGEEDRDATLRTDSMYDVGERERKEDKDEPKAQSSNVEWLRVQSVAGTERGKNIDAYSIKSKAQAPMWLYDEDNPDYKLVIIEASNEGFQSKLDTTKGSYMTVSLTTKLHENIFQNQNKRFLFEICDEIQEELHSNGKQQPTYTYYNKMKYIKFLKNSREFKVDAMDAPKDDDMMQKNNNALPEKQSDEVQIMYKDDDNEDEDEDEDEDDDDDDDDKDDKVNMEMQTAGNPTIGDANEIKIQPAITENDDELTISASKHKKEEMAENLLAFTSNVTK